MRTQLPAFDHNREPTPPDDSDYLRELFEQEEAEEQAAIERGEEDYENEIYEKLNSEK